MAALITTVALAKKYGVKPRTVRQAFKWWCDRYGYDRYDFYRPGFGFILPKEFVEWFEEMIEKERDGK